MDDFFLFLKYRHKTIKFRVADPTITLDILMTNLRNAVGKDGNRIFDLPDILDGTPTDYYFAKTDEETGKNIVLQPKIGKTLLHLSDYNVHNGDTMSVIADPIAG